MSSGLDTTRRADAVDLVTLDYGDGLLAQITMNRLSKSGTRYVDLRVDCEAASLRASYGGRAFVRLGMKRAELPGIRLDFGLEGLAWDGAEGCGGACIARNARGATARRHGALWQATFAASVRGGSPADRRPPRARDAARDRSGVPVGAIGGARRARAGLSPRPYGFRATA